MKNKLWLYYYTSDKFVNREDEVKNLCRHIVNKTFSASIYQATTKLKMNWEFTGVYFRVF